MRRMNVSGPPNDGPIGTGATSTKSIADRTVARSLRRQVDAILFE